MPLLLAHLGRDGYGLFATLTSIAGYFALLTVGSSLTVPRYVAQADALEDRAGLSAFLSTYAMLHVVVAGVGAVLALALAPLLRARLAVPDTLRPEILEAWALVAATWALGLLSGLCQSFLIGMRDVALANAVSSARAVLSLAAAWIAVSMGLELSGTVAALLAAAFLSSAGAWVVVRRRHPGVTVSPKLASRATLRATLRPASWYFLMQVAAVVVMGTDNVIIASVLGVGEVAGYAIAFQLWSLALAVLWAGVDALQPFVTRWDIEKNNQKLAAAYLDATRWTFLGGAVFAAVLAFFGDDIIRLWVADTVSVDRRVLLVFGGMLLTATPIHTAALVLAGLGRHQPVAMGGAVEAALNLVISLILVRSLGVFGVALGTLISGAVTNAWIAPVSANRALDIEPGRYASRALFPGLVVAGFTILALVIV